MKEYSWFLGKDTRGWYAHQPIGPSWVRVFDGAVVVNSHDGGCTVPDGALEALRACAAVPGLEIVGDQFGETQARISAGAKRTEHKLKL